jgi:hypothetical protein
MLARLFLVITTARLGWLGMDLQSISTATERQLPTHKIPTTNRLTQQKYKQREILHTLALLQQATLYSVILRGGGWAFANNTFNTQFNALTANLPLISSGFFGTSRALSNEFNIRAASYTAIASLASATPSSFNYAIFARNNNGTFDFRSSSRLAFYSIGESLDLARLDARVTDLINAFAVTIP